MPSATDGDLCSGARDCVRTQRFGCHARGAFTAPHVERDHALCRFVNTAQLTRIDERDRSAHLAGPRQVLSYGPEHRCIHIGSLLCTDHHQDQQNSPVRALSNPTDRLTDDRGKPRLVSSRSRNIRRPRGVVSGRSTRQELRPLGCSDRQLRAWQGRVSSRRHVARCRKGRVRTGHQGHPGNHHSVLRSPDRRRHDGFRPRSVVRRHCTSGSRLGSWARPLCPRTVGARTRHQQFRWPHDVQRFHGWRAVGSDGCHGPGNHRPPCDGFGCERSRAGLGAGGPSARMGRWIRSHHHVDTTVEFRVCRWLPDNGNQIRVWQQLDD